MAATKKTNESTEKKTTARKRTANKAVEISEEKKEKTRSIFEMMSDNFPAEVVEVETPAGVIHVRERISLNDVAALVNLIVNMCTDSETGMVKWEINEFVTRLLICSVYCGIDVPENLETGYNAVCGNGRLYDYVAHAIDLDQLNVIWDSVENRLRAQEELNCSVAVGKLNQFLESVSGLIETINSMSENFDGEEALKALGQLSAMATGK